LELYLQLLFQVKVWPCEGLRRITPVAAMVDKFVKTTQILREGRKPGVFMNPRVIPTCIAFWPGEKELNLHIKHTTLEPKCNQLFLNLGRVSHECR
jgi:hypothetical protein